MAYYGMAIAMINSQNLRVTYIQKAVKYSDHVSRKERDAIMATAALFSGNNREALAKYQDYVLNYPDDKFGHMVLG